jgi:hypothetical protein
VEKNKKYAIFDKDGRQISDWYDWIEPYGLVKGKSDYYFVKDNGKEAVFHKDLGQVTNWFDRIYAWGLIVYEKDEYYFGCLGENCAIYHKNGKKVSEDFPLQVIKLTERVNFNHQLGVAEMIDALGKVIHVIEYQPYSLKREEFLDYTKLLNI